MRSALRSLIRFAASVLLVTGALLITDVAVTVAWQEPVSALLAKREQARLGDELAVVERRAPLRRAGGAAETRAAIARFRRGLRRGAPFGRIELPTLGRRYVLIEGTDTASLRRGPGHYPATALPGEGRTVAVAGHRTTYLAPFRPLDRLRSGDRIAIRMPYGRFVYRVERTRIVPPTATGVIRDIGRERLVLTACHPLYSAKQRIVVFARLAQVDTRNASANPSRPATPQPATRPASRPPPIRRVSAGSGARGALIVMRGPLAEPRPVVVFLHGWGVAIGEYEEWIDHLVRLGNTVVAPRYQTSVRERPDRVLGNTLAGLRAALRRLEVPRGSLIVAGHSAGGALAADVASRAASERLPKPRAVFAVYPGRAILGFPGGIPAAPVAGLPRSTRLLVLAGADDAVVGEAPARRLVEGATRLPRARRRLVRVTDPRVDDHLAPTRAGRAARRNFWDRLDRLTALARQAPGGG